VTIPHKGSRVELAGISDFLLEFSETIPYLFTSASLAETTTHVLELAVSTISGCDFAGIFISETDGVTTAMQTDPLVDEIDDLQCGTGEGPCLDAIKNHRIYYADNLVSDARWPHFGPAATSAGIESALALPVVTYGNEGALNLYARRTEAFGAEDHGKAAVLASLSGLALSAAQSHEIKDRRAGSLAASLRTREIIGQAQGMLMERERISATSAFDILRRASVHLTIKLSEVAENFVETGKDPDTGMPRSNPI
jgi:hypothetical protein